MDSLGSGKPCPKLEPPPKLPAPATSTLLGGSWDLVSKVIRTLIGVISIVTLIITLVTKSHDPLSMCQPLRSKAWTWVERVFPAVSSRSLCLRLSEPYHSGPTSKARPDPDPKADGREILPYVITKLKS